MWNQGLMTTTLLSFASYIQQSQKTHESLGAITTFDDVYDYIVVGTGTAGSVVCNRLSEMKDMKVLCMEQGETETVASDFPAFDMLNVEEPSMTSGVHQIEPQEKACLGFPNRQTPNLNHNILGGGSTMNGMAYSRGGYGVYDGWEKNYGAKGWGFKDVLPYFKKSEDNLDKNVSPEFHGRGGYLKVSTMNLSLADPAYQRLTRAFIDAANELGYKRKDLNARDQIGASIPQRAIVDGVRCSGAKAFLQPIKHRENVRILIKARADKILFSSENSKLPRAVGVEFMHQGQKKTVMARKEIVLSGGYIGSAKLLLLSGVGPKDHMEEMGIPLVSDLPVGQNLFTHVKTQGVDFVVNQTVYTHWDDVITFKNFNDFIANRTGPLGGTFYDVQCGLITLDTKIPEPKINGEDALYGPLDTLITVYQYHPDTDGLKSYGPGLKEEIKREYFGRYKNKPTIHLLIDLKYVRSKGYFKLRENNPTAPLYVQPNLLHDELDIKRLIAAHKIAAKFGQTEAFQRLGAKRFSTVIPGCEKFLPKESDEYIECTIRTLSATKYLYAGTCRMGDGNDPNVVVDPRLRVRGVEGLRVADGSIMPFAATGSLMSTCYMIGERVADFIKEDTGRK